MWCSHPIPLFIEVSVFANYNCTKMGWSVRGSSPWKCKWVGPRRHIYPCSHPCSAHLWSLWSLCLSALPFNIDSWSGSRQTCDEGKEIGTLNSVHTVDLHTYLDYIFLLFFIITTKCQFSCSKMLSAISHIHVGLLAIIIRTTLDKISNHAVSFQRIFLASYSVPGR